jgi:hypothetical protein
LKQPDARSHARITLTSCRSVGIGRRTGLKIRRTSLCVWVQVPPPAPFQYENCEILPSGLRRDGNVPQPGARSQVQHMVDNSMSPRNRRPSSNPSWEEDSGQVRLLRGEANGERRGEESSHPKRYRREDQALLLLLVLLAAARITECTTRLVSLRRAQSDPPLLEGEKCSSFLSEIRARKRFRCA